MPDTPTTLSANELEAEIQSALKISDPVLANLCITRCHYLLAQAMEALLGAEAGANFHSWAVWGSRKAGVTIRQEDLDQARRDGTAVGGFVGGLVGMGCGWLLSFPVLLLPAAALLGLGCGVAAGRYVISRSRRISAQLILGGNRTVLEDIGMQTVRFIRQFGSLQKIQSSDLELFLADIPAGRSGSPNLLRYAFTQYFEALTVLTPAEKQRAT